MYVKFCSLILLLTQIITTEVQCFVFLLYCPCVGRLGNQLEQFLHTMQFASQHNFTLVLMPFIHYYPSSPTAPLISLSKFDALFDPSMFQHPFQPNPRVVTHVFHPVIFVYFLYLKWFSQNLGIFDFPKSVPFNFKYKRHESFVHLLLKKLKIFR